MSVSNPEDFILHSDLVPLKTVHRQTFSITPTSPMPAGTVDINYGRNRLTYGPWMDIPGGDLAPVLWITPGNPVSGVAPGTKFKDFAYSYATSGSASIEAGFFIQNEEGRYRWVMEERTFTATAISFSPTTTKLEVEFVHISRPL